MWIWLCLIAGIILGVIILLPEPSDDVEGVVSLLDELEEWDLQDHIEKLTCLGIPYRIPPDVDGKPTVRKAAS